MSAKQPLDTSHSYIVMGSNQKSEFGDPKETLGKIQSRLLDRGVLIRKMSRIFQTPAFPAGSGPDFANAAAAVEHAGSAGDILQILHQIEDQLGRTRTKRWGPRVIDLDLVATEQQVLPSEKVFRAWMELPLELQTQTAPRELILPHPRMQDRAFVLVPLMEVAPDWKHPVLGKTVREMCAALPGYLLDDVKPLQ